MNQTLPNQSLASNAPAVPLPVFGLIIIGDEIMSGKRSDKHFGKVVEILKARGLQLSWAQYVGDDPQRITKALTLAAASGDVVFCTGGIGATPDDHTRQCAARALGLPLGLHPQAKTLIEQRMQEQALAQGVQYDPSAPDNLHRLNMGVFPVGAGIIANPFNRIPGFQCGRLYFFPGFPVMAWPMIEAVLDQQFSACFQRQAWLEKSVIIMAAMEATLTPLMECIEHEHPGVKVFSLPSVEHPEWGRHIELGVKGAPDAVNGAYAALMLGLAPFHLKLGPELVRS